MNEQKVVLNDLFEKSENHFFAPYLYTHGRSEISYNSHREYTSGKSHPQRRLSCQPVFAKGWQHRAGHDSTKY